MIIAPNRRDTVNVSNMHRYLYQSLLTVVDPVFMGLWGYYKVCGCVITSAGDGKHVLQSQHNDGMAVDCRNWINPSNYREGRHDQASTNTMARALFVDLEAMHPDKAVAAQDDNGYWKFHSDLWQVLAYRTHIHIGLAPRGQALVAEWRTNT